MPAEIDASARGGAGVRALYYGLAAVVFLVLVAIAALLANGRGGGVVVVGLVVLWLAGLLAGLAFLIWFIITLNSIARNLREQTRITRHTARQLDLLLAREGADS